jgi:Dolichyl-phosphate-mannose-protein mannosyltransferase
MSFKHWQIVILSLILWGTRVAALESLPLHNDEGLHLTRAVEVWNGHPFWNISDGKIVNHWLIAAFYPQNSPVFIGRIATIFVSILGLAAGCALVHCYFGTTAVILAGVMWIASPYLFFYERTALSDAEAGALVVVAAWSSLRLVQSGTIRDAIITGFVLAAAVLFKFTAAPFALTVVLIVLLLSRHSLRTRIVNLMILGVTAAICFIPPMLYLLVRGDDFFGIALGWIGVGGSGDPAFVSNLAQLWTQLTSFGTLVWTAFLLGGLALLLIISQARKVGGILLLAVGLPLIIMMVFGREVLPRHYVVALPLMLVLAGAGLGSLVNILEERREKWIVSTLVIAISFFAIFPFMQTAYNDPGALPLSAEERRQFITDHSSGFGLHEAVQAFPDSIEDESIPIVASMFQDSCLRANFYAVTLKMICANAPGLPQINEALSKYGAVYVLVDYAPLIGVDVQTLDAVATKIAVYPRPGETEANASVVLWRLDN